MVSGLLVGQESSWLCHQRSSCLYCKESSWLCHGWSAQLLFSLQAFVPGRGAFPRPLMWMTGSVFLTAGWLMQLVGGSWLDGEAPEASSVDAPPPLSTQLPAFSGAWKNEPH